MSPEGSREGGRERGRDKGREAEGLVGPRRGLRPPEGRREPWAPTAGGREGVKEGERGREGSGGTCGAPLLPSSARVTEGGKPKLCRLMRKVVSILGF